jgi:DNA (cytosine-5)-methyltransferase 1
MRKQTTIQPEIPIISLFSGCGGFDLGFAKAGFRVDLAFDVNQVAVKTYNKNHGRGIARECDLATVNPDDIISLINNESLAVPRGVIGGSPCQSFSNGNVHHKKRDARHALPRKYARILKALNEEYALDFFVFENVLGLSGKKHRKTLGQFKSLFEEAGFRLFAGNLDALHFGVAQRRPRMFLVGVNADKYKNGDFIFPEGNAGNRRTVRSMIKGLPEPTFFRRDLKPEDIAHHPNHWTMKPKSKKFNNGFLKEGQNQGRSFRVLSWDKPSWTVAYGHREIHIHPSGRRRLSVYEAMRLQGLPKSYRLLGTLSAQIQQVSDAVPSQVGKALAKQIRAFLKESAMDAKLLEKNGARIGR